MSFGGSDDCSAQLKKLFKSISGILVTERDYSNTHKITKNQSTCSLFQLIYKRQNNKLILVDYRHILHPPSVPLYIKNH